MSRQSMGVEKVSIYIDARVMAVIRKLAQSRGCAYAELVREALREYALSKGPEIIDHERKLQNLTGPQS